MTPSVLREEPVPARRSLTQVIEGFQTIDPLTGATTFDSFSDGGR